MSHTALDALTVVKLKDLLRSRGQPVSGVKAALIERLLEPVSAGPVEGSIASPPSAPKSPARAPRAPARSASSARAKSARVGKRPHGGTGLNSAREAELPSGEVTRIGMDPTPGPEERGAGENSAPLRIASWNVAGLRGLLGGKNSEQGREALRQLVGAGGVDVLLLQETKLQQMHITDVEAHLFEACAIEAGAWRAAWACSAARKGYAGVAVLWRVEAFKRREHFEAEPHCAPLPIDPSDVADQEGRTLRLEIPLAAGRPPLYLVNVYTPNSGAELKRLEYRVHGWDVRFRRALAALHLGATRLAPPFLELPLQRGRLDLLLLERRGHRRHLLLEVLVALAARAELRRARALRVELLQPRLRRLLFRFELLRLGHLGGTLGRLARELPFDLLELRAQRGELSLELLLSLAARLVVAPILLRLHLEPRALLQQPLVLGRRARALALQQAELRGERLELLLRLRTGTRSACSLQKSAL